MSCAGTLAVLLGGCPMSTSGGEPEPDPGPPPEMATSLHLAMGDGHGCVLDDSGIASCWGFSADGRSTPPRDVVFSGLSLGGDKSCGLRASDGAIECWGPFEVYDEFNFATLSVSPGEAFALVKDTGLLWEPPQNPNTDDGETPVAKDFFDVGAAYLGGCVLRKGDRRAQCWGNDAITDDVPDVALSSVAVGGGHVCGIRTSDDTVVCWGANDFGQATPPAGAFAQISAGDTHTCALRADDRGIACWGVMEGAEDATAPDGAFSVVAAGANVSCAQPLDSDVVVCWGLGDRGQTNPPTNVAMHSPSVGSLRGCALAVSNNTPQCFGDDADLAPADTALSELSCDFSFCCGIVEDTGLPICWGQGAELLSPLPTAGQYANPAVSNDGFCALRDEDGRAECWTSGTMYDPPDASFSWLTASDRAVCGLTSGGALHCWGDPRFGIDEPPTDFDLAAVDIGTNHACGLNGTGTLRCWGEEQVIEYTPDGSFSAVSSGAKWSCGLRAEDGTAQCWGNAQITVLPEIPLVPRPPEGVAFDSISAGARSACGIRSSDKVLVCFGTGATRNVP